MNHLSKNPQIDCCNLMVGQIMGSQGCPPPNSQNLNIGNLKRQKGPCRCDYRYEPLDGKTCWIIQVVPI